MVDMKEKQLYRTTRVRKIYTYDRIFTYKQRYNLQYGIPNDEAKLITNWRELLQELNYDIDKYNGTTDRKGKLYCAVDHHDKNYHEVQSRLYAKEFSKCEISYEYRCFKLNEWTIAELSKELKADDFIQLLKDNGVTKV